MARIKYKDLFRLLRDPLEYLDNGGINNNEELEIIFQEQADYGKIKELYILFGIVQLDTSQRVLKLEGIEI